jgi:AraC-like DNA-binding protein
MGCLLLIRSGRRGMLIVETIGRIRREHFVKGKSIKEIARDLKISRNTVRKVLRSGETSFSYEREIQPRPKLGQWRLRSIGCWRATPTTRRANV